MKFSSILAFAPLSLSAFAGPAPDVYRRELDLPGNLAAIVQGVTTAVSSGDPTGVLTALQNVVSAADAPTTPEQALETLQAIFNGTGTPPATLYEYIADLEALNLIDSISSLLAFVNGVATGQDSTNNVNPAPPDVIYPQKLSCDTPYTVDEATLRAAIYIPLTFTYGQIPPVILFPGTGNYGYETFSGNFIPLLQGSTFADPVWVNVPGRLLNDAQKNAEFAAYAINYITSITSKNVTMLAWSQGNIDTQWAFKYWPSTTQVTSDHVAISPDYAGTVIANFVALPGEPLPPSVLQQEYLASSNFITTLRTCNGDSGYVPTTTIYSGFFDEIVEPQQGAGASAFLNDVRGVGVTNNQVQFVCAGQPAGTFYTHEGVLYNPLSYFLLRDAMSNSGPGNPANLDLPTVCSTYLTPGLDLGSFLVTENAIAIAGLAILTYPSPVFVEPAISAYATTCPVSTCLTSSSTSTSTTMSSTSTATTSTSTTTSVTSTATTSTTTTMSITSTATTSTTTTSTSISSMTTTSLSSTVTSPTSTGSISSSTSSPSSTGTTSATLTSTSTSSISSTSSLTSSSSSTVSTTMITTASTVSSSTSNTLGSSSVFSSASSSSSIISSATLTTTGTKSTFTATTSSPSSISSSSSTSSFSSSSSSTSSFSSSSSSTSSYSSSSSSPSSSTSGSSYSSSSHTVLSSATVATTNSKSTYTSTLSTSNSGSFTNTWGAWSTTQQYKSNCEPQYEKYLCDDDEGHQTYSTHTIFSKGCPGYTETTTTTAALAWETWSSEESATTNTWDAWDDGKKSVTITFIETWSVPCSTGWEETTKTFYTTHCGCTETPVPQHPSYTTYTTQCPDSWGVGKTVTLTVPYATWTPDAASTWADWQPAQVITTTWTSGTATYTKYVTVPFTPVSGSSPSPEWTTWPSKVVISTSKLSAESAEWQTWDSATATGGAGSIASVSSDWAAWSSDSKIVSGTASTGWSDATGVPASGTPTIGAKIAQWTGAANHATVQGGVVMAAVAGLVGLMLV